jgi:hypothetical protein
MERGKKVVKERESAYKISKSRCYTCSKTVSNVIKASQTGFFFLLNKWNTKLGSFPITNAGPISTSPQTNLLLDFKCVASMAAERL